MIYAIIIITALIAYLVGSINPSIMISRMFFDEDIRENGSGNAGATNMLRTHGKKFAIITLILDILKGIVGVFIGIALTFLINKFFYKSVDDVTTLFGKTIANDRTFLYEQVILSLKFISGILVVIGHSFPVYFKFKGGKGVATSLGVIIMLNAQVGLITLAAALIVMLISRYVSLGSISAAIVYVAVDFTYMLASNDLSIPNMFFDILLAAVIILRHSQNIKRLFSGNENKLFQKKDTESN